MGKTFLAIGSIYLTSDFGKCSVRHVLKPNQDLKWFRFEVWDIAENGAFTQPVYLSAHN